MRAPPADTPLVSIITATYNRSNVLEYALRSALRSTVADWEHLVIGDACTDDSADVVARLGDARLSFHNLPANFSEQAYPKRSEQQGLRAVAWPVHRVSEDRRAPARR